MKTPVALFVYNRPWHTSRTIETLRKNLLATETDLFIFADAPKITGNPDQDIKNASLVVEVRELIKAVSGFKSVTVKQPTENIGLANSIIAGVTEIINRYGKIIVVEDDLVSSPYFLRYMNNALDYYETEPRVFNVSAFAFPPAVLQIPPDYLYDTYFLYRNSSWGWGTWQDRWRKAIWDHGELKKLVNDEMIQMEFNKGGEDLYPMLLAQLAGTINSWSIRWSFSISYYGGVSLTPVYSYINNIGFDGTGVHCDKLDDDSGYRNDLSRAKRELLFPPAFEINREISRRFALCYGKMPLLLASPVEINQKIKLLQQEKAALIWEKENLLSERNSLTVKLNDVNNRTVFKYLKKIIKKITKGSE